MAWTIEAKIFPLGTSMFDVGSHLFLEIFDDQGNRVLQINGLAADRAQVKSYDPTGDNTDQLMVVTSSSGSDFYIGASALGTRALGVDDGSSSLTVIQS